MKRKNNKSRVVNIRKITSFLEVSIEEYLNKRAEKLDIEEIFNFSEIPSQTLREQYESYSINNEFEGYRIKTIKESQTASNLAQTAKKEMSRIYGLKDWQIVIRQGCYKVEVIILYAGIFKNTKIIKDEMKRLGFFPSRKGWKFKNLMVWKALKFEPYIQAPLTAQAKQYGKLFHLTLATNHSSIANNGIIPKSENNLFDYPNRVYVMAGNIDTENVRFLGFQLYSENRKKNKNNNGVYNLYEINTKSLPRNIDFYGDVNYPYGYYTDKVIPFDSLTLITQITYR